MTGVTDAQAPWPRRYASRLFYTDVVVVLITTFGYGLIFLSTLRQPIAWSKGGGITVPYWLALIAIVLLWLAFLDIINSRDEHIVGRGSTEYQRLVRGSIGGFAAVLAVAFFLQINLARSIFLILLPLGTLALVFSRWVWRQWLRRQQRIGSYVHRAVVIGEIGRATHIVSTINSTPGTGYDIIGIVSSPDGPSSAAGVPIVGTYDDAEEAVLREGADTVIFIGADDLDLHSARALGWAMADLDISWVVAPAVTDVAGPRIHSSPVAGLPLVHISYPRLEGAGRIGKRLFDAVAAFVLIVLLSPVMLAVAIAVRIDGPGGIFYTQERVGRNGSRFGMIKFRSMVQGADDQLASLLDLQGTDQPLFKVVDDPRITRVGRFLRRHSLDELPQLFNVLSGEMSLVGPRPQRPAEVALYDNAAHRRLLVKPGMSGLWQVSGRSSLDWADAIRLDLYYVENWSFTGDIVILFRTVKAVVNPGDSAH